MKKLQFKNRFHFYSVFKRYILIQQILFLFTILSGTVLFHVSAQPLAGTDDLNRVIPQNSLVGSPQTNKTVAMFYFLWQGHSASPTSVNAWDLTEIYANHPSVVDNYNDPNWGTYSAPAYYFWGKPIYDYYKGDDYWVHLKNVQLLTDAGVDILVVDATNTFHYPAESNALMNALDVVRAQGKNAPKIVFYTNTNSGATMQNIYNDYYKVGAPYRHPDCWYYLNGKPLIIGVTSENSGKDYKSFFTYRESQWPDVKAKTNGWPWIEFVRPQKVYSNSSFQREIINVSVAQHPKAAQGMGGSAFYGTTGNWGRSFRNNSVGNPLTDVAYGYNFQEQWDYAITQNTPFIFVTGWNEWIAGRWASTDGNPQHSYFCDLASPEFSRDIEPTLTGDLKDNYYMQFVSNVRKYKGVEAITPLGAATTISQIADWADIALTYSDYTGDVQSRNNAGAPTSWGTYYPVNNNGFETPVIANSPGFTQWPTGGGWTFSGPSGIVKNNGAYGNPAAVEGLQACYIQQVGSIQQSLTFSKTALYTLSFSAAQRVGSLQTFNVYLDGSLLKTFTPTSNSYVTYSTTMSVAAGSHVLKFSGTTPTTADNTAFIDNIMVGIVSSMYTNTTGRNDFDKLKVARDANNLYFYAKTVTNISANTGANWMCLYLDLDRNAATGWKGYDYRVTSGNTLQKQMAGAWVNIATVLYTVSANEMYISIPRASIGNLVDPLDLEFKWSDNMQDETNPLDWYVNGDAAPGGRFNFIVQTTIATQNKNVPQSEVLISPNPTSNFLNFSFPNENAEVYIFNSNGVRLIEKFSLISNTSIDISNLPIGIYFAKIKIDNNCINKKIIKQ